MTFIQSTVFTPATRKTQSFVEKHETSCQFHLTSKCNLTPWQWLLHFNLTFYIWVRSFVVWKVNEKLQSYIICILNYPPSEQCDCPGSPVPLGTNHTLSNIPVPHMLPSHVAKTVIGAPDSLLQKPQFIWPSFIKGKEQRDWWFSYVSERL